MIFDTDVLIWASRKNGRASEAIDFEKERFISVQTYLELLQDAENKLQIKTTKSFLADFDFKVLPLTENVGHRAMVYQEEYCLSHGLRAGDAIIAATATEFSKPLMSGNHKHFKAVRDLDFRHFKPHS